MSSSQKFKTLAGAAAVLLLNDKTWTVTGKLADVDSLVSLYGRLKPHMTDIVGLIRGWGWLAGIGLLLWSFFDSRSNSSGTTKGSRLKTPRLRIHSAHYGIGFGRGQYKDVTDRVQGLVFDDKVDFIVGNDFLGGDPFPHQKKHLEIEYSIRRDVFKREGERFAIPE